MWFSTFRNNSLKNYRLSLGHYLNTSSLSWDSGLKMKKVVLKLIRDPDMYKFFEQNETVQETEFLIFVTEIAKPAISI